MAKRYKRPKQDFGKYRSEGELWFSYWLDELKQKNLIHNYTYEEKTYELLEQFSIEYQEQLKTKIKTISKNLTQAWRYTPDFIIDFCSSAVGLLIPDDFGNPNSSIFISDRVLGKGASLNRVYIDVKGAMGNAHYSSYFTFAHNQKMMLHKHNIYVNKCEVTKLFEKTFVPNKVFVSNVYKRGPKIGQTKFKFKPITVDEFISRI